MTKTPDNKRSYSLLPVEEKLLGSETLFKERLSYLPPVPKLTVVIHKKMLFVKSVADKFKYLRIFMFCTLMEAYSNEDKQFLLTKFKKGVYGGSTVEDCPRSDGRLAKKINDVPFNQGAETEAKVLELFVDTMDSDVLKPFEELMACGQTSYQNLEECRSWMEEYFGDQINVFDVSKFPIQGICMYLDGQSPLAQSCRSIEVMEGMSVGSSAATPNESVVNTCSRVCFNKKNEEIMELSISKHPGSSSEQVVTPILRNKSSARDKYRAPTEFVAEGKSSKGQGFNLWDYLCC